jgi:hypothetical protein
VTAGSLVGTDIITQTQTDRHTFEEIFIVFAINNYMTIILTGVT